MRLEATMHDIRIGPLRLRRTRPVAVVDTKRDVSHPITDPTRRITRTLYGTAAVLLLIAFIPRPRRTPPEPDQHG